MPWNWPRWQCDEAALLSRGSRVSKGAKGQDREPNSAKSSSDPLANATFHAKRDIPGPAESAIGLASAPIPCPITRANSVRRPLAQLLRHLFFRLVELVFFLGLVVLHLIFEFVTRVVSLGAGGFGRPSVNERSLKCSAFVPFAGRVYFRMTKHTISVSPVTGNAVENAAMAVNKRNGRLWCCVYYRVSTAKTGSIWARLRGGKPTSKAY
jgi:hypothetical protein